MHRKSWTHAHGWNAPALAKCDLCERTQVEHRVNGGMCPQPGQTVPPQPSTTNHPPAFDAFFSAADTVARIAAIEADVIALANTQARLLQWAEDLMQWAAMVDRAQPPQRETPPVSFAVPATITPQEFAAQRRGSFEPDPRPREAYDAEHGEGAWRALEESQRLAAIERFYIEERDELEELEELEERDELEELEQRDQLEEPNA